MKTEAQRIAERIANYAWDSGELDVRPLVRRIHGALERYARKRVEEEREECVVLAQCCHGAGAHTRPQEVIAAAIRGRKG